MSARICIIVFTSAHPKTISAGHFRQGKLGMLSFITDFHIDLRQENQLLPTLYNDDLTIPLEEEKPVYMTKPAEKKDEKKTMRAFNINDLEEIMGTSSLSDVELVPA